MSYFCSTGIVLRPHMADFTVQEWDVVCKKIGKQIIQIAGKEEEYVWFVYSLNHLMCYFIL